MSGTFGIQLPVHHRAAAVASTSGRPYPSGKYVSRRPLQSPGLGGLHLVLAPAGPRTARQRIAQLQTLCAIKKGSEKTIVCSKTLEATPGREKKVAQRIRDIVDFSKGRMAVRGSGLLAFEAMQDRYEPNVFHFWERYDSNVAMGRHNNTPEFQAFMKEVQTLLTGPIGMALYEWKDGKIGQQCIQGGPKGEGGLDDATGAGGAGGASMKQSSGTVDLGKVRRGDEGDAFGMGFRFPWQKKKENK